MEQVILPIKLYQSLTRVIIIKLNGVDLEPGVQWILNLDSAGKYVFNLEVTTKD